MELSQVIDEIKRIPPERLSEVYHVIHSFRLGLESDVAQRDISQQEHLSTKSATPANYNFSDLAGRLTWQGNALATQQSLRDEW